MKLNNKGFTLVEGLLIVIALSLVSGVGYYVYNSNKDGKKDEAVAQVQTQLESEAKPAEKKYLEIKEHGIKFELSDEIKDAYYAKSTDGYIYFSTHYFDNLKGFEYCKAEPDQSGDSIGGLGLYALVEAKVGEKDDFGHVWTEETLSNDADATKVGDTYYFLMKGNGGPCYDTDMYSEDSPEAQKLTRILNAFREQQKTFTQL